MAHKKKGKFSSQKLVPALGMAMLGGGIKSVGSKVVSLAKFKVAKPTSTLGKNVMARGELARKVSNRQITSKFKLAKKRSKDKK